MPKELEKKLRQQARKIYPHDKKSQDRYVYGTLRHIGWTPNQSRRAR